MDIDVAGVFKRLGFQPRPENADFYRTAVPEAARRMDEVSAPMDFTKKVFEKLSQVNAIQQESLELTRRMTVDPDSVDAHDVMMSLAEANMSLNITKAVLDRVIRAYRDITGAR